jgi:hypothetical protein
MKIISNTKQKIRLEALDMDLNDLYLDYEMTRRLGGKILEVVCFTFMNEDKRDAGMVVNTNVPQLRMIIKKNQTGISIQSNFYKEEIEITGEEYQASEELVEKCINACYQNLGYEFEENKLSINF